MQDNYHTTLQFSNFIKHMKWQQAIQLSIPDPCTQSWDDMHMTPGGRHCDHCQKTVVDFTRMTDKQLLDYFSTAGASTCGRLTNLQIDRILKEVEVPRKKWLQRVAAGILLVLGLSKQATGQSIPNNQQTDHPFSITEPTPVDSNEADKPDEQTKIHCVLVDENNNPIVNASVNLLEEGIVTAKDLTDFDGLCDLSIPHNGLYDVKFSYIGKSITITNVVSARQVVNVKAMLVVGWKDMRAPVIIGMVRCYTAPLIGSPGQQTKSGDMIPNGW